ncbi:ABC-F family ATP-binding cassette domain-containing protein [Kaustia mangrovi]|uniref:ABC-F family ATP-binding cassette domain-containing protein n=1 Tax=Kaustia mangrovi TaxID=2593653 RepID=A0A7S8C7G3_9HYPH|nr:ABC-F family ATP-binding cassette domain-containing protein [Kaustia mangrovi]QPC44721.1 ABC-F family ATP-binding cassette domain-containing protein [Kaustia mangrovi]
MLHINALTYRIEGRTLLQDATAAIPAGHRVGLVGRNGTGKSTLLKIITGGLAPDAGSVSVPRNARIGQVAQEAPGGPEPIIDVVLAADTERTRLMAEADTATDPHRIAEIHTRLADIDAHSAPARAATILAGLGFPEAVQDRPCSSFSGGWRMRIALAAALFAAPDVLLLDEPTNYLDLEGTLWLQSYLRSYPYTVIIVSHDRDLLNAVPQSILHLDQGRLTLYAGNYDRFERTRAEEQARQLKMKKRQDDERRRIQSFVDRFRAKASKARQAQSRLKMLERMQPVTTVVETDVAPFHFPEPQRALNPPLIRFEDAAVGYEPGKPILRGLDLRIDPDDRIALLGSNGNGKSTFAKLIAGKLSVQSGAMRHHKRLEVGYFAQHQVDALNAGMTPYDYIRALMEEATEAQRRAKLGAFGFGERLADNRVETLSGGEKARLTLMLAAFKGPHILLLDEPTNHLDIDSRAALVRALNEYEGAVIMISHDRHLIEASADRLWLVADGTVKSFEGDLDDYTRLILGKARAERRQKEESSQGDGADSSQADSTISQIESTQPAMSAQDRRRAGAEARARVAPLKRRVERVEKRMAKIRREIEALDERLADPSLYETAPEDARAAAYEHGRLAKQLEDAEEEWLEASTELEAAHEEAVAS